MELTDSKKIKLERTAELLMEIDKLWAGDIRLRGHEEPSHLPIERCVNDGVLDLIDEKGGLGDYYRSAPFIIKFTNPLYQAIIEARVMALLGGEN